MFQNRSLLLDQRHVDDQRVILCVRSEFRWNETPDARPHSSINYSSLSRETSSAADRRDDSTLTSQDLNQTRLVL